MAEAFGIVSGAIGIASAFTACVDCFNYVQLGRHIGRDFNTDFLALKGTQLRLVRWGRAVRIDEDPKLGRPDATTEELQTVYDTLFQILVLFSTSQKISNRYVASKPKHDLKLLTTSELDPTSLTVADWMRIASSKAQPANRGFLKATSWALYHRTELRDLVGDINRLFDTVEKLFSANDAQMTLAIAGIAELKDREAVKLVLDASENTDPVLHKAAEQALGGHMYRNVEVDGTALLADEFADGWVKGVVGKSHQYDGVRVGVKGEAQLGNKYGGQSFLGGRKH